MSADVIDLELAGFRLPADGPGLQRRLVGDSRFHDERFLRQYDFKTLFYDCFLDPESGQVQLLGPPLLNLKRLLKDTAFSVDGQPTRITEIEDLSRCSVVTLDAEHGRVLGLQHQLFGGTVPIGRSYVDDFRGLNALYTISLNNRLDWIADWLDYYVGVHGAEAVVLADNGSTAYSPADLRNTLGAVSGLKRAVILRARYPFGPTAPNKAGYAALFLQRSLAELGRRRFLARAGAVLNADIDELFHSLSGQSVFDATKASAAGYLRGDAVWVYAPAPGPDGYARHSDHTHVSASGRPKANRKWCVVPEGPQQGRQWLTHFLGSSDDPVDPDFRIWHFRQISTGWKYDRTTIREELVEDPTLVAAMENAFRGR
jgi:hypothetical protein